MTSGVEPIPAVAPLSGFFWVWVVPALLFALAFFATWALYRRFSRAPEGDGTPRD